MHRAVDIAAPPEVVWLWICQLKVAPYSYDLVDNMGRRSPRALTPGVEQLAVGQRWITVFRIVAFEPGVSITGQAHPRTGPLLGPMLCTYAVHSAAAGGSRLVVRLDVATPTARHRAAATALAWGDLAMMRKQLLTLKKLAEG